MHGRTRAVVFACMSCALLVSAFAAQSAGAASNGTTLFTCKNTGAPTGTFTKAHCKDADTGVGNYSHVEVKENTTTHATVTNAGNGTNTNESTISKLKSTKNGIALELQATGVHGESTTSPEGGIINKKNPTTGEHFIHGEHIVLTYTGVTVKAPAGKECKIYTDNGVKGEEGVIHTEPLTVTSAGQGDSLKFTPTEGEVFARFFVEGCKGSEALEGLNGTYTVTGSITCKPDGATINCNHNEVTTQNTLKLNGTTKAGYEGTVTVKGGHTGEETTPLSVTTVATG